MSALITAKLIALEFCRLAELRDAEKFGSALASIKPEDLRLSLDEFSFRVLKPMLNALSNPESQRAPGLPATGESAMSEDLVSGYGARAILDYRVLDDDIGLRIDLWRNPPEAKPGSTWPTTEAEAK